MDYNTGKSRGFGFVHFKDPEVEKIVLSQVHHIQGRTCEVTLPRSNYKASASVIFHVVAVKCSLSAKLFLQLACSSYALFGLLCNTYGEFSVYEFSDQEFTLQW